MFIYIVSSLKNYKHSKTHLFIIIMVDLREINKNNIYFSSIFLLVRPAAGCSRPSCSSPPFYLML